jgi:hypothetical protein
MSPERTQAYRRVTQTLNELGPSKLLEPEQDRIRSAADSLIFCGDLAHDEVARTALEDVENLCRSLIDCGRWEHVTAMRLSDDVWDCGPGRSSDLGRPGHHAELRAA